MIGEPSTELQHSSVRVTAQMGPGALSQVHEESLSAILVVDSVRHLTHVHRQPVILLEVIHLVIGRTKVNPQATVHAFYNRAR